MKKRIIMALGATLIASSQAAASGASTTPYAGTQAQKAAVLFFSNRLREPDAARYQFFPGPIYGGGLSAGGKGGWHMCGVVNSKNGFGGYTGFVPFIVLYADREGVQPLNGLIGEGALSYSVLQSCYALFP